MTQAIGSLEGGRSLPLLERLFQRWRAVLAGGFLLVYAACVLAIDAARPLWFDEILTVYLSRLPAGELWRALARGADGQPPLSYLLTHLSFRVFGESAFAARLPESVAFLVFVWCLFWFVRRRTTALYAAVALLFPFVTLAGAYSYEARPYAILLACAGVAAVCWQRAAEAGPRQWGLAGLAISVAVGVSSHFFAVLLPFPIACAELARWWKTRRFDWAIPAALLVGLSPLVWFTPLIAAGRVYSAHFWNKVGPAFLGSVWTDLYGPAIPCLLLAAGMTALSTPEKTNTPAPLSPGGLRFAEWTMALALLFLPVIGFLVALLVTGTVHPRYVLASVAGAGILAAGLAQRYDHSRRLLGTALCGSVAFFSAVNGAYEVRHAWVAHRHPSSACVAQVLAGSGAEDVVVASPFDFTSLSYQPPPGISSRLVYLADPDLSVHQIESDTTDRVLIEMSRWAPLQVEPFRQFVAGHPRFPMLVSENNGIWVTGELRERNAAFQQVNSCGDFKLFRITLPRL